MKRILTCLVLAFYVIGMLLTMPVTAVDNEYERFELPVISDKLKNGSIDYISMYKKKSDSETVFVELAEACNLIGAGWHVEDGGFIVNRDCIYFRCDSDGNMKLVISSDSNDRWTNPDEVLLEGELFPCEKIGIVWYVDFISFCDMFGASISKITENSIQSIKDKINNLFGSVSEELEFEEHLDFTNHPYYILVYSGTSLSSLYRKVFQKEDTYLWSYSSYENENIAIDNLFDEIKYSDEMISVSFNVSNLISNVINDDYGITKIMTAHYESSEHYKQSLINVIGVDYGQHLNESELNKVDSKGIADNLKKMLNYNTIVSSSLSTSNKILDKYLDTTLPQELNGIDTVSKLVNFLGSPYQAYMEMCEFHNKLNGINESKIELLNKAIIENNSINKISNIQRQLENTALYDLVIRGTGPTILMNSMDNYAGLTDSSKDICELYKNSNSQFQEQLKKSIESESYVIGDELIQNALEKSGVKELILASAILTVYDGFMAWTKENYGEDLQNSEEVVQYYFIERTMQKSLDLKCPDNLYNRLLLMLQASLCCYEFDKDYFNTQKQAISEMIYELENSTSLNIHYYHDPRKENVSSDVRNSILKYSDRMIVPVEDETDSTEIVEIPEVEPFSYTWHVEPTIEADNIIVSDNSLYEIAPSSREYERASDKYSVVQIGDSYSLIDYNGKNPIDEYYIDYSFSDIGGIVLYKQENSNQCCIASDGWGKSKRSIIYPDAELARGASGGYTDFYYDEMENTVYGDNSLFIKEFDGKIEIYGEKCNKAVLVQSADVKKENDSQYLSVENQGGYGVSYNDNITIDTIYDDGKMTLFNNYIALQQGDKWGYFDGTTGKQIIAFVCNGISLNHEIIRDNNTGSVIREATYPYLFSDGYLAVYTDAGCGYYDTQGNEIISCGTFEEVRPVHNDLAWVKKDGKWGIIQIRKSEDSTHSEILNNDTSITEDRVDIPDTFADINILDADNNCAYIAIANLFNDSITGKFDMKNGKAYETLLTDTEISTDKKPWKLNTLFLSGNNFYQYVPGKAYSNRYSGTYKLDTENRLIFSYEEQRQYESSSYDLKRIIYANDDSIRSSQNMVSANKSKIMLNAGLSSAYGYYDHVFLYDFNCFLRDGGDAVVYLTDKYIIAEQPEYSNYSIQKSHDNSSYNLITDNTQIQLSSDSTWKVTAYSDFLITNDIDLSREENFGTWELYDKNILILYPPADLNSDYYNVNDRLVGGYPGLGCKYRLFYVDFEKEKIYIPLYARCDSVADLIHQNSSSTTENSEAEIGTQYSAIDLINKTIPEIIDIMGGEYEVTEGPTSGDLYIYNHSTLPGIQLRVFIDWLRAWDNDSLNVKQIKEDLESGFYNDFWIEVHDNAFATPDISADMNYEECCSILGELECVTGTIGTGAPDSECYIFIEDDKQIELHFDRILDGNYIHSYDEMIQYNPHLICVLVKHANQG